MGTFLAEKMFTNCITHQFETEHRKPLICGVLLSLVWPTTLLFNCKFGIYYFCLFQQLEILPVPCQYIRSLMKFIDNNQRSLQINSSMHNINTRNKHHIHWSDANLSCFRKSTSYAGINIFSCLPTTVAILKNEKAILKAALRKYLHTHCF